MNKPPRFLTLTATCLLASLAATALIAFPSVYPTGTTIYQPDQTWNG
ncbi:MAG: hypothetical protein MK319_02785 [Pseudomonadales bacterium]|nr:hypothetical protein [Pseudomonadales bacterium]